MMRLICLFFHDSYIVPDQPAVIAFAKLFLLIPPFLIVIPISFIIIRTRSGRLPAQAFPLQLLLKTEILTPLAEQLRHRNSKQQHRRRLPKFPPVLIPVPPGPVPAGPFQPALVRAPQRDGHVQVHGELQEREREDEAPPARAEEHGQRHDDEEPRGRDGDVGLVGGWVGRRRDEPGVVAAAWTGGRGPLVQADAEEDGEGEEEEGEEVGYAVATGKEAVSLDAGAACLGVFI